MEKIPFERQVRTMYSPGLTLAFRKELLNITKPLTLDYGLTYDITIGLVAAAKGGMYRLNKPYVFRRIHSSNASNPELTFVGRVKNYAHHVEGRRQQLAHMQVIYDKCEYLLSEKDKKNLKKRIASTRKAVQYLEQKKVVPLAMQCLTLNPMDNKRLNLGNVLIAAAAKGKNSK